jgi:hypothetical protein
MVRLATIEDSRVVRRILTHLGLPTETPQSRSARALGICISRNGDAFIPTAARRPAVPATIHP